MSWSKNKFQVLLLFLVTLSHARRGSWEKTETVNWKTNCFRVTQFFTWTASPCFVCAARGLPPSELVRPGLSSEDPSFRIDVTENGFALELASWGTVGTSFSSSRSGLPQGLARSRSVSGKYQLWAVIIAREGGKELSPEAI